MVRTFLAPLAMLALLSGCISIGGGSEPPEQLITFTPREMAPAGDASSGAITDAIMVFEPEVEDRLDVNRVPVRIDASGVAYLKNATYVDRPARLFQSLLAETLRARSDRLVISGEDPGVKVRTRVYGHIIEAGYDAPNSTVSFVYDAVAVAPDGTVRQRRFISEAAGVPAEAAFVAPALNEAANDIAGQIAGWVIGQGEAG